MRTFRVRSLATGVSAALVLAATVFASSAHAVPIVLGSDSTVEIVKNPDPLGTTAVTDVTLGTAVGDLILGDGTIHLEDQYGNDVTAVDPWWWTAPGTAYQTTTHTIWIDLTDPNLYITSLTFNIGANQNAGGWIRAYYEVDGGSHSVIANPIGQLGPTDSPSFGVNVVNPSTSCARITRIEIEPPFTWAIGNIRGTDGNPCVGVPEPGPAPLIVLGLLTLGLSQFFRNRQGKASLRS